VPGTGQERTVSALDEWTPGLQLSLAEGCDTLCILFKCIKNS
jgi:hypothetical protein